MAEAGGSGRLREVLPRQGLLHSEDAPGMVLCKPKLLPLKSVTLEKMEQMQRDTEQKARDQARQKSASSQN